MDDNWNPMKEDYDSVEFNSYNRGIGAKLRPDQMKFDSEQKQPIRLYIVGIPMDMNKDAFQNLFAKHGHVLESTICKPKPNLDTRFGKSSKARINRKLIGFVTMSNLAEVNSVIRELDGKPPFRLRIKVAEDRPRKGYSNVVKDEAASNGSSSRGQGGGFSGIKPLQDSDFRRVIADTQSSNQHSHSSTMATFLDKFNNGATSNQSEQLTYFEEDEVAMEYYSSSGMSRVQSVQQGVVHRTIRTGNPASLFLSQRVPSEPCTFCGQQGQFRCFTCKCWYCNENCQLNDWPKHKLLCTPPPSLERAPSTSRVSPAFNNNSQRTQPHSSQQVEVNQGKAVQNLRQQAMPSSNEVVPQAAPVICSGRGRTLAIAETVPSNSTRMPSKGHGVERPRPLRDPYLLKSPSREPKNPEPSADVIKSIPKQIPLAKIDKKPEPPALVKKTIPEPLPLERNDKVKICFMTSPSDFWVNKTANKMLDLEQIGSKLQTAIAESSNEKPQLKEGMICAALYELDNFWYRAKVVKTGIDGDNLKCVVQFIDYGNTENTSVSNIQALPEDLINFPAQAYRCGLADVCPVSGDEWPQESLEKFHLIINDVELVLVESKNAEILKVVLKDLEGNDIGDLVVSLCDAVKVEADAVKVEAVADAVKGKSVSVELSTESKDVCVGTVTFIPGQELTWTVTHIKRNPMHFCATAAMKDILQLIVDMEIRLNTENLPVHIGLADDLVAARAHDGAIYRAIIVSVEKKNNMYRVRFIDYGNEENVTEIRKLSDRDSSVPSCCYNFEVIGSSSQVAEDVKRQRLNIESSLATKVISINDGAVVLDWQLPRGDGTIQLKANPWHHDIGLRGNTPSPTIAVASADVDQSSSKANSSGPTLKTPPKQAAKKHEAPKPTSLLPEIPELPRKPLVQGEIFEGVAVWIEPPGTIFIQKTENNACLEKIMATLSEEYSTGGGISLKSRPPVGTMMASRFPDDGLWYRARVTAWLDNRTEVILVDYGNRYFPTKSDMRVLPAHLFSQPACAYPTNLEKISSLSKDAQELLMGQGLWTIKIVGVKDDSVSVVLKSGDVWVNDPLAVESAPNSNAVQEVCPVEVVNSAPAVTVKTEPQESLKTTQPLPFQLLKDKETFDCTVIWIESPHLFVQKVSDQGKVSELMSKIKEHCDRASSLSECTIGTMACAKFTDGIWYRAHILSSAEKQYEVLFIDFGNTHRVGLTDLKDMPKDASMTEPPFLFKVSLEGVNTIDSETFETLMSNIWTLKLVSSAEQSVVLNSEDFCINKFLKDKLGIDTISESSKQEDLKGSKEVDLWKNSKQFKTLEKARFVVPGNYPVQITWIASLEVIFAFNTGNAEIFNEVTLKIQNYCATLDVTSISCLPPAGSVVLAQFSADKQWYRASVLSKIDNAVEVLFFDYGNKDTVTLGHLAPMPEDILALPVQGIRCRIQGLKPGAEATPEYVAELKNGLESRLLNLEFVSLNAQNNCYNVKIPEISEDLESKGLVATGGTNSTAEAEQQKLILEQKIKELQLALSSLNKSH